jgi:Methane oxygenase PmoA
MMIRFRLTFLFILMMSLVHAQKIATLEVALPKSQSLLDMPVSVALDAITFLDGTSLTLSEVIGSKRVAVPFQVVPGEVRALYWLVRPELGLKKRVFELALGTPAKQENITPILDDQTLTIKAGNKNLLRYQHGVLDPPVGVDASYKRSGFIHPLWSPNGQELTRIQPKDHYHHFGIWNPWTHVLYKGDTVDFWNIGGKKGTVRFANFISTTSGSVFAEFQALHEHVVMKKNTPEEVAMNELQTIRVYRPDPNQLYYIVDFTFQMNCATENPVTLLEYRYGGFGWRTTEQWNKDNSEVITSEGKARKEADGSKAKWCIVQGEVDKDYAGAVMMSSPTNYNHPEPLRIWPENQYNRGDMFANFAPTKDMDWILQPGKKYVLKYRLVVFNGTFTPEKAGAAWETFAAPLTAVVK